jgi:hypothetical protein
VTTVKSIWNAPRPSVPAVRVPAFATSPAQAHALGLLAVTAPTGKAGKNNSMGTVSYLAEGTAVSILVDGKQASVQLQTAKARMAQGGNARGIPPRGRPV